MDFEDEVGASTVHMAAGALAGSAEHLVMFPLDTIKTHVQSARSSSTEQSLLSTTKRVLQARGVSGLYRGFSAVLLGAGPAHAIYFASYEFFKYHLGGQGSHHGQLYQTIAQGLSGACSSLLSEGIHTPMDTIKQKRQLSMKGYSGTFDCFRTVVRTEGFKALYASYTTTLIMGVPFNFFYFPTYEFLRKMLKSDPNKYDPIAHVCAGGGAGAFAAGMTNPFDVSKTRLQTQGDVGKRYSGMLDSLKRIWIEEGLRGYTKGIVPRMIFYSTSAGLSWATYEYFKHLFGADKYLKTKSFRIRRWRMVTFYSTPQRRTTPTNYLLNRRRVPTSIL